MGCYQGEFARSATKDLRKVDRNRIPQILERIASLAEDPRPTGCRKLTGSEPTFRIRVGDYRVTYEVEDDKLLVLIVRIRHRSEAYQ
jgi:mRNA interferase RelE/StbE